MSRLALVAAALVLLLVACGDDEADDTSDLPAPSAAPAPSAPSADDTGSAAAPEPAPPGPDATDPPTTDAAPTDEPPPTVEEAPAEDVGLAASALALAPVGSFEQPLDLVWAPDGTGPFVAEKTGRLYLLDPATDERQLVLDLSGEVSTDSERGLLGVEFSPDGRWLYSSSTDLGGTSRLQAHELVGGFPLDPGQAVPIMEIDQPFSNHNGGDLATGPDGHLYWAMGDGGSAGDPEDNGQDPQTLLGNILRIDPRPLDRGYVVPSDNPFVGNPDLLDEIWLWGLRNPWKISFDAATGDLWIGDVGQGDWEEITRVDAGSGGWNLGWNCFEGFASFAGCEVLNHLEPTVVYDHGQGVSVTGGHVYRGSSIPGLGGAYVFGDFGSGTIWTLPAGATQAETTSLNVGGLSAFGQDPDGELWTVSIGGEVSRIVAG
ncbi:MAG: PQQ-dependent sugar dehydrogenase [Actinomycetota bacterium]